MDSDIDAGAFRDATTPRDANASDSGAFDGPAVDDGSPLIDGASGDSGPSDAGPSCSPGAICAPAPCQIGVVQCDGGVSFCQTVAQATNGSGCDAGAVCDRGTCTGCSPGTDCSEAGSCQRMMIACTSGTPTCTATGDQPNGSSCGSSLYCNAGSCGPCTDNAPCVPASNPCHQGTVSCASGAAVCTDTSALASDGTPCGTNNQVCLAGKCVACTAGAACNPGGDVCKTGATSCATGQSVCVPNGAAADGTACNDGNACTTNDHCTGGVCGRAPVVCTASDSCHMAGTCTGGTCSNPLQPDGHSCGTGFVCSGGTCSCTSCPAGEVCNAGGCTMGCLVGGTFYPPNTTANNGCGVCSPNQSSTQWTPVPGVGSCPAGQACSPSATCAAGCTIGGTFFPAGATANNGCAACAPINSTTAWTPVPGVGSCPAAQVCNPSTASCGGGCFINNAFVPTGATNPSDSCQACVPLSSTTLWTTTC